MMLPSEDYILLHMENEVLANSIFKTEPCSALGPGLCTTRGCNVPWANLQSIPVIYLL